MFIKKDCVSYCDGFCREWDDYLENSNCETCNSCSFYEKDKLNRS